MYFLSYGTKPFQEDSFLRYNQARTRAQGLCRAKNTFFRLHLFSASFFPPPLLSSRFLHFFPHPHPWTRDAKYTIRIASSRKNSGAAFVRTTMSVGEARRGEARPPCLVSGGSLLKAKQTFSQSQPLWRSNNRSSLSLSLSLSPPPPPPPLARKNWSATGEFVYSIEMRGGERQGVGGIGRVG